MKTPSKAKKKTGDISGDKAGEAAPRPVGRPVVAVMPRNARRAHALSRKAGGERRMGSRPKSPAHPGVESTAKLSELHFHPLLESTPTMSSVIEELRKLVKGGGGATAKDAKERLEEREPEWRAFVGDVKRRKVQESVVVVPRAGGGWHVVDGRNRTCAAREAGLETVPIRITTERPEDVILGSLAARRHVSKELLAYVALECHPYLIGEGERGRPKTENRHDVQLSSGRFASRSELSEAIGVSEKTLMRAAEIHRKFITRPKLRKKWEWRLYAGTSFKGILAGDAAETAGGDANGKPVLSIRDRLVTRFLDIERAVNREWAALERLGDAEVFEAVQFELKLALAKLPDAAFDWVLELAQEGEREQVLKAAEIVQPEGLL